MQHVIVFVRGGVVQDIECPAGVEVEVRDYDVSAEDAAADKSWPPRIKRDEEGDYYESGTWGGGE